MNDRSTFERRLAASLQAYAEAAPVDVEPAGLAGVIAARNKRRGFTFIRADHRPAWLMPVALGLLLLAALALGIVGASLLLRQQHRYDGIYVQAPDMSMARDQPIVVPLRDGRVLIAGGQQWERIGASSLDLFDPLTMSYTQFSGDIPIGTGTGMELDDGRVFLVAYIAAGVPISKAFVIDVAHSTSHELAVDGTPVEGLFGVQPSIALLNDGRVLVTGGQPTFDSDPMTAALLFDPALDLFTPTGPMVEPRIHHALVVLQDGRVLAVGGSAAAAHSSPLYGTDGLLDDAEIYDPATGAFTLVGHMPTVRGNAWAMLLADGRALVMHIGATDTPLGEGPDVASPVDLFTEENSTFVAAPLPDLPGQATHTALPDGRMLMTGSLQPTGEGVSLIARLPWSALYDPISGTVTRSAAPRAIFPIGAVLADGRVVLAGGYDSTPGSGDPMVPWVEIFE